MSEPGVLAGSVLIVDDDAMNRLVLSRSVQREGFDVVTAADGRQALAMLATAPVDVVLLDIVMPEMDGYQVLTRLKADPDLRHLPVIVISALEEMDSVVRCIEMGAEDYLPKPFDPVLLRARINAGLAKKRLQDLEREYLHQVNRVVEAAAAVEAGTFELDLLEPVAQRSDALGGLGRVFQRMAREVASRERQLQHQVRQLRIEIDESRTARRVAEITETDYFARLQQRVDELRKPG